MFLNDLSVASKYSLKERILFTWTDFATNTFSFGWIGTGKSDWTKHFTTCYI